jgi:hypothetical protein
VLVVLLLAQAQMDKIQFLTRLPQQVVVVVEVTQVHTKPLLQVVQVVVVLTTPLMVAREKLVKVMTAVPPILVLNLVLVVVVLVLSVKLFQVMLLVVMVELVLLRQSQAHL